MNRRNLLKLGGLALAQAAAGKLSANAEGGAQVTPAPGGRAGMTMPLNAPEAKADYTLRIAPVTVELDPTHILSTIGYNGTAPGPVLRMREGKSVIVEMINDTDTPELVHWHGMLIPPEVDGAEEEGSPFVPPHGHSRVKFTPRPAGSRWYHTHVMSMDDLHKGTYTGQFGFVFVDSGNDPGNYDQELFLALRDWEPFFAGVMQDDDDDDSHNGPLPEKPPVTSMNTAPNGLEVTSMTYSMNDKALGSGEPIRVKQGQKLLIHFLNASAIENRRIALAGHKMRVIAMDGNPVPTPQAIDSLLLGVGERADVEVEMNNPGIWILGAIDKPVRDNGLGVVVEYADQHQQPQWIDPPTVPWDYSIFGSEAAAGPAPQQTIEMVITKIPSGAGKFNLWLVNGKPYPHENELVLQKGVRYRLIFRNRTDDSHPIHMHRHVWEIKSVNDKPIAGLIKDTVVLPYYGRAVVDFTADQPGLTLFHCHMQQHMDYGFKALFRYA